jgi:hypothetical protein
LDENETPEHRDVHAKMLKAMDRILLSLAAASAACAKKRHFNNSLESHRGSACGHEKRYSPWTQASKCEKTSKEQPRHTRFLPQKEKKRVN